MSLPPSLGVLRPSSLPCLSTSFGALLGAGTMLAPHRKARSVNDTGLPKHLSVSWTSHRGVLDMWPDEHSSQPPSQLYNFWAPPTDHETHRWIILTFKHTSPSHRPVNRPPHPGCNMTSPRSRTYLTFPVLCQDACLLSRCHRCGGRGRAGPNLDETRAITKADKASKHQQPNHRLPRTRDAEGDKVISNASCGGVLSTLLLHDLWRRVDCGILGRKNDFRTININTLVATLV